LPASAAKLAALKADGLAVNTVNVGSKGSWEKAVNGGLEPKAAYVLDNGHTYVTDTSGRVNAVVGELDLKKMDRNTYQQCVAGKCGDIGDQGGHLIAATLGGAGDRINLVPQSATLNNGPWKTMENEFKAAIESGKKVSIKIDVGYPPGGGVRPNEFKVFATIDGVVVPYRFTQ
jgi:filamentous hemagglutinin